MQTSGPRMPFEFPYATPESLSFVPLNPHVSIQSGSSTQHGVTPKKRTQEPTVTGTSVLGIRYKDGVMLSADTLTSYGSLARFRSTERLVKLTDNIIIGATGEYSDFQYLVQVLEGLITENDIKDDGSSVSPHAIHSYATRLLYNRRSQINPLWGQFIIAGYENGKSTLGFADLRGTAFEDEHLASGYGAYIARPLLRKAWRADLTEEEAKKLLEDCMRVLFYRDARTYNRIQIAIVNQNGVSISKPYSLETDWSMGNKTYDPEIKNLPNLE